MIRLFISFFLCLFFYSKILRQRLNLWSLRFEPTANLYELWLEDSLEIKPDIADKVETLSGFLRFFWGLKVYVTLDMNNS